MFKRSKEEKKEKRPEPSKRDQEKKEGVQEGQRVKIIDIEEGRAEMIEASTSIPYVESYKEDIWDLESSILLKDGNREGLLAQVKLIEDVKVEQDHDANIESMGFNGKLNIENPSKVDRLWDIELKLKNIEQTNLESNQITIKELGTSEEDSVESHDFNIEGEAKNLLLVKEYINTLPNADEILNISDIETDLIKLKEKTAETEEILEEEGEEEEEEEKEEEEEYDGGSAVEDFNLESFGISIDKEYTVTFAIGMRSLFEKPLYNIMLKKTILDHFTSTKVIDTTMGVAVLEENELIWKIDVLEPETTVLLKFTCDIITSEIEAKKTGEIEATYEASSSFIPGLGIDTFEAYARNKFHIDIMERDEEPGVWDCKLTFENTSEFFIELYNVDCHITKDDKKRFVSVDPEDPPLLPTGAQWHSNHWDLEHEDYPQFKKIIEFRVLPSFQTLVNGNILIHDVELILAAISGTLKYDVKEIVMPIEEEEGVILIPTYQETDINATLNISNDGSAPLNELKITHQPFSDIFQPPNLEERVDEETGETIPPEVQVLKDGKPIDIQPDDLRIEDNALVYDVKDLKDRPEGMFDPDSIYELKYPIHAVNPIEDAEFDSNALINANTYPIGPELEYLVQPEETPVIRAVHLRRRYRLGKEIIPLRKMGEYQIILYLKNIGETNMPLMNFKILDKVPDNFERKNFSREPETIDLEGEDLLKWQIDSLEEGEEIEITYEIKGTGKYEPSKAQVAY